MDLTDFEIEYKSWKECFCPYLNSKVIFTSEGFSHLIWKKGQEKREVDDILSRMQSLKYVVKIIEKSHTLQEYENNGKSEYFSFIAIVNHKKFKVVVAKNKSGKCVFVSVIPRWITNKRDKELKKHELKNPSNDG